MTKLKRRRWTTDFLRELVMTGDARLAAERAGVDHSEVWLRRLQEPNFAGYWEAALRLRAEFAASFVVGGRAPSTIGRSANGPPPRSGED